MSDKMVKRHTTVGIFIHWFNALSWLFLMFTGLGLISNPALNYLGGYPDFVRGMFGGGATLLKVHWVTGAIWASVWVVFIVLGALTHSIPFVKQVFSIAIPRDLEWVLKKNFQMTLGYRAMGKIAAKFGLDARIPDQEYYNAGQKLAAQLFIVGGLCLAVTGTIMTMSKYSLEASMVWMVQWSILLHWLAAGFTFGMLLLHVYMAAISREERPAFISMFTGKVPLNYAKHHHKLWYDEIKDKA